MPLQTPGVNWLKSKRLEPLFQDRNVPAQKKYSWNNCRHSNELERIPIG
jgi:hypothetical protein